MYLLAGVALPMWVAGAAGHGTRLAPLAGLLALGVVDAAGAAFGSAYGRTRWPILQSRKTLEGSAAALAALLASAAALDAIAQPEGLLLRAGSGGCCAGVSAAVALVVMEASTPLIDNIVLPLYALALALMLDK